MNLKENATKLTGRSFLMQQNNYQKTQYQNYKGIHHVQEVEGFILQT